MSYSSERRVCGQRLVLRGWLRKRVVLEVNYSLDANSPDNRYRPAGAEDLRQIENREAIEQNRRRDQTRSFPPNIRVRINDRSSFSRGLRGRVVMQEPSGGVVWVRREGTTEPAWFYSDELDPIDHGVVVVV